MPENVMDATYCTQQIVIPPSFPHILKVFAKAAIRTQPYDLLTWAHSYFKAMACDAVPPVKERLEYPLINTPGGLSYGYLKLLVKQFEPSDEIEKKILRKRWLGICLCETELKQILCVGGLYRSTAFPLHKFIAVAAGFLCENLKKTMILLCEIYTDEPDGSNASVNADFFVELYRYLAKIEASTEVTYFDGLTEAEYEAKKIPKEIEEKSEDAPPPCHVEWVPKMMGWKTESTMLKMNSILGEELPIESKKVSKNITIPIRPPREKFTDPRHPQFPNIPSQEWKCHIDSTERVNEDDTSELHLSIEGFEGSPSKEQVDEDNNEPSGEEKIEVSENEEQQEPNQENKSDEGAEQAEEEGSGEEKAPEEQEGLAVSGSNVMVRVFSEEGKKIRSLSSNGEAQDGESGDLEKEDISVKEREAIIEQLEMNKEKRVNEFMETIESLDSIVEETKKLKSEADKIGKEGSDSCSSESSIVQKEGEKSLKDVSTSGLSLIGPDHIPEVVTVQTLPGIGHTVEAVVIEDFVAFVEETASYQAGVIMPRNILHVLCPPLE